MSGICALVLSALTSGAIRTVVSSAQNEEELLQTMHDELLRLVECGERTGQGTTMVVVRPPLLANFLDYNDFAEQMNDSIEDLSLDSDIQLATFHPEYQFAGTEPDDVENYTNRSPFPVLHLLRTEEVTRAIAQYKDGETERIWQRNERTARELGPEKFKALIEQCKESGGHG